ncbi:YigZ family protein [Hydrogenovibrio sp. SC-1]|uniref:YigZ family protein n=1 Tax=Hydrogenovibrio sp. SC-1 TaxID=2065820 RepID=UPI000C7A730B|nr:YigZ family protein [Hydrogenovibrio sp. SC-1]PLA74650.1 YigZ family protein [Hydrogenovibrio sp. SC-1]
MAYLEPVNAVVEETEIKKSRFIAYAKKVVSRQQAMEYVSELRVAYPDARHVCWGYVIGDPNNSTNSGCNDDGEPSGTAGKPILSQIHYSNIGNVVVVIVRYFGGIRLGAGGLVRAYRESAQKGLKALQTEDYIPKLELSLDCPYEEEALIRRVMASLQGEITDAIYTTQVNLLVSIPTHSLTLLQDQLASLSATIIEN